MIMEKTEKTNAIRSLDAKKIKYQIHYYDAEEAISGVDVARVLNEDVNKLFKTLVTVGKSKKNYVFIVPGDQELDLKKAAKACNEKSIEMIKSKELLPLTGYIHGGCSPVGMKKLFKTFIHISAKDYETIFVSGGKRGIQIELSLADLEKVVPMVETDLIVEK